MSPVLLIRYVGEDGVMYGGVTAELENEGDKDVVIDYKIEVFNSDRHSHQLSSGE